MSTPGDHIPIPSSCSFHVHVHVCVHVHVYVQESRSCRGCHRIRFPGDHPSGGGGVHTIGFDHVGGAATPKDLQQINQLKDPAGGRGETHRRIESPGGQIGGSNSPGGHSGRKASGSNISANANLYPKRL
jgi:hypothetical protein